MAKCKYCGNTCNCGKPDCKMDVCPECAKPTTITLKAGETVVILDKLADTGKDIDNKIVCEVYKKVVNELVEGEHEIREPYRCKCAEPDHSNLFVAGFEKCNRCKKLIDVPAPTGEPVQDQEHDTDGQKPTDVGN